MLKDLQRQFEHLESTREALSQRLAQCSVEQLRYRSAPETWSPAEIVHHLVLAESFAVAYLEKKLEKISTLQKTGWRAALRSAVLTWALRAPLKFKAPSPLVLPKPDMAWDDLRAQWQAQREKLQTLLERVTPETSRLALYRHPVAGLLTPAQMLSFLQEHFDHHEKQIAKLIARKTFSHKNTRAAA